MLAAMHCTQYAGGEVHVCIFYWSFLKMFEVNFSPKMEWGLLGIFFFFFALEGKNGTFNFS